MNNADLGITQKPENAQAVASSYTASMIDETQAILDDDQIIPDDAPAPAPAIPPDLAARLRRQGCNMLELRAMCAAYLGFQDDRIAAAHTKAKIEENSRPGYEVNVLEDSIRVYEAEEAKYKVLIESACKGLPIGVWAMSHAGIGPIVAGTLISNLDFARAKTPGAFVRFGGMDPTRKWFGKVDAERLYDEVYAQFRVISMAFIEELCRRQNIRVERFQVDLTDGQMPTRDEIIKAMCRLPWNAAVKRCIYIYGTGINKLWRKKPTDAYIRLFRSTVAREREKNLDGTNAPAASQKLSRFNIGDDTSASLWYRGLFSPATARNWYIESDAYNDRAFEFKEGVKAHILATGMEGEQAKEYLAAEKARWLEENPKPLAPQPDSSGGVPMLPPAHILSRGFRRATKQVVMDLWYIMHRVNHGVYPPKGYAFPIAHRGHTHEWELPNKDVFEQALVDKEKRAWKAQRTAEALNRKKLKKAAAAAKQATANLTAS